MVSNAVFNSNVLLRQPFSQEPTLRGHKETRLGSTKKHTPHQNNPPLSYSRNKVQNNNEP